MQRPHPMGDDRPGRQDAGRSQGVIPRCDSSLAVMAQRNDRAAGQALAIEPELASEPASGQNPAYRCATLHVGRCWNTSICPPLFYSEKAPPGFFPRVLHTQRMWCCSQRPAHRYFFLLLVPAIAALIFALRRTRDLRCFCLTATVFEFDIRTTPCVQQCCVLMKRTQVYAHGHQEFARKSTPRVWSVRAGSLCM